MAHSDCGWTCGCAGKTVKSLENMCHTWALLRWWYHYEEALYQVYAPLHWLPHQLLVDHILGSRACVLSERQTFVIPSLASSSGHWLLFHFFKEYVKNPRAFNDDFHCNICHSSLRSGRVLSKSVLRFNNVSRLKSVVRNFVVLERHLRWSLTVARDHIQKAQAEIWLSWFVVFFCLCFCKIRSILYQFIQKL